MKFMNELEILKRYSIKHRIVRAKTKRLVLKYDRSGVLVIRCPMRIKQEELEEFVSRHIDWVIKHYESSQPQKRQYIDGEKYLFLGKEYEMKIINNRHESVIINDSTIFIYALTNECIPLVLKKWKYEQAEMVYSEILYKCFEQMKNDLKVYPKLSIKKYLSRWGCCYPKRNEIILNIALIHVPLPLIEYVMFHELSHFKYLNHQPAFHSYLQKYCPNERKLKAELKNYHTNYE